MHFAFHARNRNHISRLHKHSHSRVHNRIPVLAFAFASSIRIHIHMRFRFRFRIDFPTENKIQEKPSNTFESKKTKSKTHKNLKTVCQLPQISIFIRSPTLLRPSSPSNSTFSDKYYKLGRYKEELTIREEVLTISPRLLGEDHVKTLKRAQIVDFFRLLTDCIGPRVFKSHTNGRQTMAA